MPWLVPVAVVVTAIVEGDRHDEQWRLVRAVFIGIGIAVIVAIRVGAALRRRRLGEP